MEEVRGNGAHGWSDDRRGRGDERRGEEKRHIKARCKRKVEK